MIGAMNYYPHKAVELMVRTRPLLQALEDLLWQLHTRPGAASFVLRAVSASNIGVPGYEHNIVQEKMSTT